MTNLKICIILAYFGNLPTTIDIWLKSCQYNPTIDFLVYSDSVRNDVPLNVRWINDSFDGFRTMVREKLKMEIKLDSPYECCDFKAVYGTIFEDYLVGYDYWGFCDMDMVFGDLKHFFEINNLEIYDKFHSWGHLTLMRNTRENNERYKLPCNYGKGYKDAFTTSGSTHFCESEINQIYNSYGFPFFDRRICADISPAFKRMRIGGKEKNYNCQTFYWQNGKIWRAYLQKNKTWKGIEVEEFAYIHFQKRKMNMPDFDVWKTDRFYICSNYFLEKKNIGYPTVKDIEETNPYKLGMQDTIDYIKIQIQRVIKHLVKRRSDDVTRR